MAEISTASYTTSWDAFVPNPPTVIPLRPIQHIFATAENTREMNFTSTG